MPGKRMKNEYRSQSGERTFSTKTRSKLKQWRDGNNNFTPFLYEFSRNELNNMGYDDNVYYSLECLKAQRDFWISENKKNEYNCPVCYDKYDKPIVYTCGHGLCKKCDEKIENTCPICRASIYNRTCFHLKV